MDLTFIRLLVPDLLHEFELGIWKAVFTHLLRILYDYGERHNPGIECTVNIFAKQ